MLEWPDGGVGRRSSGQPQVREAKCRLKKRVMNTTNIPRHPLGTTDILIDPIFLGTWQAGNTHWVGVEDTDSLATIQAAYEAGLRCFDTAIVYGSGHSERLLGQVLKPVRKEVVIASKVIADELTYQGVIASCEKSLTNLNTDYIDLFQIHWPAGSFGSVPVPIEQTMRAMNKLQEQGKIRATGVSNFSLEQLQDAMQYSPIASLQPPYSLFWRHIEEALQPFCQTHQISILAYSPLSQGLLTGKFGPTHQFHPRDNRMNNRLFQPDILPRAHAALKKLRPIAEAHHTTLGNLSLAWLMHQPQTSVIAGARRPSQIKQSIQAVALSLSDETLREISSIGMEIAKPFLDTATTHL